MSQSEARPGGVSPGYTVDAVIITFTANPSLDRTAPLGGDLRVGAINRLGGVTTLAAGKGVNVSAAVHAASWPTLAIVPLDSDDPLAEALRQRGVPARTVPVGHRARTNLTIAHPDGRVTKINEPGETMTRENVTALVSAVMSALPGASWLCLCGSLPPGAPADWYVRLTQTAHEVGVKVAVDASGPALDAVLEALPEHAPDVWAPNAMELEHGTGLPVSEVLSGADLAVAVEAAERAVAMGIPTVIATLGHRGAMLATEAGVWLAVPEPIQVVSAVSSGDSALAGYLLAMNQGANEADALHRAVAYGTACCLKQNSEVPEPWEADDIAVTVSKVA